MYRINEGVLNLPHGWHDRSINIISSTLTGQGTTMTITRDDMPWGMKFEDYAEEQTKQVSGTLKNFELIEKRNLKIDLMPAVELECRWVSAQGKVHQIITMVLDGQKILMFTASVPDNMSDTQKEELRKMVASMRLESKRG